MVDKDLLSIQEARSLVRAARTAQAILATMNQEQVDDLVLAISLAAAKEAETLAKLAVEETGFGKCEDKKAKNLLASEKLHTYIKPMKTIGIVNEDRDGKIIEIATPAGIIAGIIPSTNPTSTAIYKAMIAIKAGNAIVFTPHPSATGCIKKAVDVMRAALETKGAPGDLINVMSLPSIVGTNELMKQADLILATGGPGMVKAAYSSGTPALGVGAGNVPVFIERSANIESALDKILLSKTFDNGTVCASEQAIVTENVIADKVKERLIAKGGHFLTGDDLLKVRTVMERPGGSMNPAIVGRDAAYIASLAGISIPAGTKVLVCEEEGIGPRYHFSKEKLTALLGFYRVETWQDACEACFKLLKNGGLGHSLAIHSENDAIIREFAMKKPVSRLLVNTPSTHGAVGLTTNLFPSFTLGCGPVGGSSTSDNVSPDNLFSIRRVAYGTTEMPIQETRETTAAPTETGAADIKLITEMILKQFKELN